MHVHRAGLTGEVVVPHRLEDVVTGEHHAPVGAQQPQQFKLLIGELHQLPVFPDLSGGGVDLQIAAGEHALRPGAAGPAQQGLYPGLELHDAEGLDHIVVRPRLQALHLVHLGGPGGEHEHRGVLQPGVGTDAPEDLQPVHPRQHDVQDKEGGLAPPALFKILLPGLEAGHLVAHGVKIIAQHLPDALIVFNDHDGLRHGDTLLSY